jgi:hypothetical protein
MDRGGILIFILFAAVVIVAVILGSLAARKRRGELARLAARLGLQFSPDKDSAFADGWSFLAKLARGSNRYAFNILSGEHEGHRVFVFDYHYRTGSGKNTQHHYLTFFILLLPGAFPELTIAPEGLLSKLAQALGYADIDFESAEFSRAFCVRSKDKRFAYDVCNAQMMEYLLANRDLDLEIEGPALALTQDRRLSVAEIEGNLARLLRLRALLPGYLFDKT